MKRFMVGALIAGLVPAGAYSQSFGKAVTVYESEDVFFPALVLDPLNNVFVAYQDGRVSFQVRVARSTNGGATFTSTTVDFGGNSGGYPSIAATADRKVYVTYLKGLPGGTGHLDGRAKIFFCASTNQGQTFQAPVQISTVRITSVDFTSSVAVDSSGKIYVVWCESGSDSSSPTSRFTHRLMLRTSVNGGQTFSAPRLIAEGAELPPPYYREFLTHARLAVTPRGEINIVWTSTGATHLNETYRLAYVYSSDGQSFTNPVQFAYDVNDAHDATSLAINKAGNGSLVYHGEPRDPPSIEHISHARLFRGAVGPITQLTNLPSQEWEVSTPAVAVDSSGKILAGWSGEINAPNEPYEILIRQSTDGGNTFGSRVNVSQSPSLLSNYTSLAYNRDGDPAIVYRDGGRLLYRGAAKIILRDARNREIANTRVRVSKVRNNPPLFSDSLVGTFRTSGRGELDLPDRDDLVGDSIKVSLQIKSEPATKHQSILGTMYTLTIDNAKFDTATSRMSFDEVDSVGVRTIVLDHTSINFNVVASVEWDAELQYLQSLESSFRLFSNYLYDVTNGQMRLDTVMIYDNKVNWDSADFQIYANNVVHPHVQNPVWGMRNGNNPVEMPRRWFGNRTSTRNGTWTENPLNLSASDEYRTKCHEFGHYALGLYDEYVFVSGGHCPDIINYGFMQYHYDNSWAYPANSEMSDQPEYAVVACQNNNQYYNRGTSCWQFVEIIFESMYVVEGESVFVRIARPSEMPNGRLLGPNDSIAVGLNYDVGRLVQFPIMPQPSSASTLVVSVYDSTTLLPLSNENVRHRVQATGRIINQGATADTGKIRALGVQPADTLSAAGIIRRGSLQMASLSPDSRKWAYGMGVVGSSGLSQVGTLYRTTASGTALDLFLRTVEGDYPLIMSSDLASGTTVYKLASERSFSQSPLLVLYREGSPNINYPFSSIPSGYAASITDLLTPAGYFSIWAVDDSSRRFFITTDYVYNGFTTPTRSLSVKGPNGASDFVLDSLGAGVNRVMIVSSPYPVIRTGLDSLARQAGETHSVSVFPGEVPRGISSVTIRYDKTDLDGSGGSPSLESSLRIFRWDEAAPGWVLIGGSVDTVFKEVTARISLLGVYGAFTTSTTGIDEGGLRVPQEFKLHHNYPNPFNPTTIIKYEVPTSSLVRLSVFDILGREVRMLVDDMKPAGTYELTFDGHALASGVYFYRIKAEPMNGVVPFISTKKMMLVK